MSKPLRMPAWEQGFSLIEVITTIALFSFIMVAVGGIFAQMSSLQRRGFAAQAVQENVTYVLETMAREIRVSTLCSDITCTTEGSPLYDCSTTFSNQLFIKHPVNGIVLYTIFNNQIVRSSIQESWSSLITSPEVAFTRFNLCILGGGATDNKPARVGILLRAESVPTTAPHAFVLDVQTTVTSRSLTSELQSN